MCTFATQGNFAPIIASFASATAGLIQPKPGRVHFNLNARSERRFSFNIDACFDMVTPVDLPERIVEVRK